MDGARFAVAHSTALGGAAMARDVADRLRSELGRSPSIAVAFVSSAAVHDIQAFVSGMWEMLRPERMIGCVTIEPVASDASERPSVVVWSAALPRGVGAAHLGVDTSATGSPLVGGPDLPLGPDAAVVVLADPFSFPMESFLRTIPAHPVVGGLASGGVNSHELPLILDDRIVFGGAVVAVLPDLAPVTLVAQGCEPVGPELTVTAAAPGVIVELAGVPADRRVREAVEDLLVRDPDIGSKALLVGIVVDENVPEYERGNFLVRGIQGRDGGSGGLIVGTDVRVGQTVRLHLRDEAAATADLRAHLADTAPRLRGRVGLAGLLFTCLGRTGGLFADRDHDVATIAASLGLPVVGMASGGEVGPVRGRSHLHGYTAVLLAPG